MTSVFTHPARVLAAGVSVLAVCVAALAACALPAHAAVEPGAVRAAPSQPVPATTAGGLRAQQPADPTTDANSESTLPPGPRIEPEESEQATQDRVQRKAIVAAVAAGLLAIVIVGHKKRSKHKKPGKKK